MIARSACAHPHALATISAAWERYVGGIPRRRAMHGPWYEITPILLCFDCYVSYMNFHNLTLASQMQFLFASMHILNNS